MKKTLLIAGALLALTASMASAQGLGLAWDDCRGTGGTSLHSLACTSNTANNNNFIASLLVPAPGLPTVNSATTYVDIFFQSAGVPAWWMMGAVPPNCRLGNNLLSNGANSSSASCLDQWNIHTNPPSGGSSYIAPSADGPNHALLRTLVAIDALEPGSAPAGAELYLATTQIKSGATVGTPSCAGCQTPACLTLYQVDVTQSNDPPMTLFGQKSPPGGGPNTIAWQTASACDNDPTPTNHSTWGKIKAIYR
jgi:hypothetical protein